MKTRILIADDNVNLAGQLADFLSDKYDVAIAHRPIEATVMLEASHSKASYAERYAVAIIDLSFALTPGPPGVEGFTILNDARRDPFLIPIIFTGTGNEDKAAAAASLGAFRYVKKTEAVEGAHAMTLLSAAIDDSINERRHLIELSQAIYSLQKALVTEEQNNLWSVVMKMFRWIIYSHGNAKTPIAFAARDQELLNLETLKAACANLRESDKKQLLEFLSGDSRGK